jgi:hypothetical protein
MGQVIGQILPLAVGAAISPVPIIAAVLLLMTPRATSTGAAYVRGWLLGLVAFGALVLLSHTRPERRLRAGQRLGSACWSSRSASSSYS